MHSSLPDTAGCAETDWPLAVVVLGVLPLCAFFFWILARYTEPRGHNDDERPDRPAPGTAADR